MASSRLQMHASPQGVLNPYRVCTEHMGKCRAPELHVRKGSTELCNSHSSLPGKRGSAWTGSHQQLTVTHVEGRKHSTFPCPSTIHLQLQWHQPPIAMARLLALLTMPPFSSKASGPTPHCSGNSVLCQPSNREGPVTFSLPRHFGDAGLLPQSL